ncbi:MAG TPA: aromatic-ring-hydroxylating dioxygenase subunit beta [Chloroflexota bacterium]|jgi:3-phenylpropionate/cinnamic acid dioxygenase small subunit
MSQAAGLREAASTTPEQIVEAFQRQEILLLQSGRYREWLAMLTDDVRYWVPVLLERERRDEMLGGDDEMAWVNDDREKLTLRVERVVSGYAVEETPPVRLRYFVQNLQVTPSADGGEIAVISNLLIYRTRRDQEGFYVGGREDVLRAVEGVWKLARRKVVFDKAVLGPFTHSWIFF